MIRIAIRGFFSGHVLAFEDRLDLDEDGINTLLPLVAEKHAYAALALGVQFIEIEFLDETDPTTRFFYIRHEQFLSKQGNN